jgi:hypothetical protein
MLLYTKRCRCYTLEWVRRVHVYASLSAWSYSLFPFKLIGDIRLPVFPEMCRTEKIESKNQDRQMSSPSVMSNRSCLSAFGLVRTATKGSKPFRITPPPPTKVVQQRTFLTRRSTSFYTHSYPQGGSSSGVEIPYIPPSPERVAGSSSADSEGGVGEDGKRKERKAKYLESLMDKAGELSLRCRSVLMRP